jgi:16S rRNA (cytidine1402-2'-O)-methyltransferase
MGYNAGTSLPLFNRMGFMLYLIGTPIGNLGDISHRALETLRQVDLVASEDTRKTGLLLKHFDIKKPQVSFYEHNEAASGERVMERLRAGQSVAVVTNAGMPGISDPGFSLVRKALAEDIPVTVIPGPTAFVMAVVLSGLPTHSFTFRGFLPRKSAGRRKAFAADRESPYTLIYYESPYRLKAALAEALEVLGDRQAAVANDLTKMFERVDRGKLSELLRLSESTELRGEYVLVVAGVGEAAADEEAETAAEDDAGQET